MRTGNSAYRPQESAPRSPNSDSTPSPAPAQEPLVTSVRPRRTPHPTHADPMATRHSNADLLSQDPGTSKPPQRSRSPGQSACQRRAPRTSGPGSGSASIAVVSHCLQPRLNSLSNSPRSLPGSDHSAKSSPQPVKPPSHANHPLIPLRFSPSMQKTAEPLISGR
jgi:hypothetical protein